MKRSGAVAFSARSPGGAMPKRASFSRPAAVIQSVVHAGASEVRTVASKPASARARRIDASMTCVAGQPE
jgi:hypothetical protein